MRPMKIICSSAASVFLSLFSLLLLYGRPAAAALVPANETDWLALLELKAKITRDPIGVMSSWNDSTHFCHWHGVACSRGNQRVNSLDLNSLKLEGSLPPDIGNLSFLEGLDLQNNGFQGKIPPEVGRLGRLWYLGLENNSFGGEIPVNISRCTNLRYLRLGNNRLVGEVPNELGSLSKLVQLFIYFNNLSGEIPSSLGNLSSLLVLSAAGNSFHGSLPASLGLLGNLTYLAFGNNNLSGTIPPSIFNLSSLAYLHLPGNQFHGTLPSNLGFTLPNLEVINVANNQITGPIPASISNATDLMRLTIPMNKFTGKVPSFENVYKLQWMSISVNSLGNGEYSDLNFLSSLANCTSLGLLALGSNNFGGILPDVVGNFSSQLKVISLENNQISGTIPTGLENLLGLEILYLAGNQFSGIIPIGIGKLQNLTELNLNRNKFSGNLPSSLGNLTLLSEVGLEKNKFVGSIPPTLGKCQRLVVLDLSDNNLTGPIPPEVIGLSSLSIYLDLSQNQLTGSLPGQIGKLNNLAGLDLSENKLTGEIPSSLGSCTSLEQLILKGNSFEGSLPPSLSLLRGLQYLDLSQNNFSGQVPIFLESFSSLQKLNLSFNNFDGKVPIEGIFRNASAISLEGNAKLCGGIPELNLPVCSTKGLKKKRSHFLKWVIPIISGVLVLILILSFAFVYWVRRRKKEPSSESTLASVLQVSYGNLLKATGGFSSDNLIGVGSFGSVYKGILDQNPDLVAVKVLNLQRRGAEKSFMAECEALRSIRHRNLVKVITACSSIDFQGNDFKALVYEFMVNGSLEDWLHQGKLSSAHEERKQLSLVQRLSIAIDVARALDYIHHYCQTPIVHCDLKPSNVLLDKDMVACVGDFGLVRFLSESAHNSSDNQTNSIGVRGTVGYAAPEYGMGGEVSASGDVYSYGILLLEMFTNRRPTDESFKDGLNLHGFAIAAFPDRVAEIADPTLLRESEGESSASSSRILQCLVSVIGVGVACSEELPRARMSISDAAAELDSIKSMFLASTGV